MSIFDRPKLAILLCLAVVFGHIPAWTHYSQCGTTQCCVPEFDASGAALGVAERSKRASCFSKAACCSSSSAVCSVEIGDAAETESPVSGEHDPNDCVLCQWLASATGYLAFSVQVTSTGHSVTESVVNCQQFLPAAPIFSKNTRGPPVLFSLAA